MALCQNCISLTFVKGQTYCKYYKIAKPSKSKCKKYVKDDYIDTSASYKKKPL